MDKEPPKGIASHSQTLSCPPKVSLQSKILTIPKAEDMVLWSGLHEAMFTPVSEGGMMGRGAGAAA